MDKTKLNELIRKKESLTATEQIFLTIVENIIDEIEDMRELEYRVEKLEE